MPIAFDNGMLPPLIDLRNKRDASVWSRCKKHRACDRVDGLPIWACSARIARLLVKRGKGDRHACVFSHGHIQELLHRSGTIRGECGTLYSLQHIRVCLRQLEDFGLVRWRRLMPGDFFPSRSMVAGGGDVVKRGACVYEVNMAALLGEGPVWRARTRRPGKGGRPAKARPDPVVEREEIGAALEAFRAIEAPPVDDVEQLAEAIPEELEAPPEASASSELEAAAPSSEEVIIHDLEQVIIHDHCSLPASQDLNFDPERVGAAGARGLTAANEAGATRPREIRAPRGLSAANEASETPPDANGSHASHDESRGADAPSARREREHDPSHGDRETAAPPPRVRSSGQRPVHPNGRGLFVVDPGGVEHSIVDVVRTMPEWFRAMGRRGAPAPLSIRKLTPSAEAPPAPPDWHDDDHDPDNET